MSAGCEKPSEKGALRDKQTYHRHLLARQLDVRLVISVSILPDRGGDLFQRLRCRELIGRDPHLRSDYQWAQQMRLLPHSALSDPNITGLVRQRRTAKRSTAFARRLRSPAQ